MSKRLAAVGFLVTASLLAGVIFWSTRDTPEGPVASVPNSTTTTPSTVSPTTTTTPQNGPYAALAAILPEQLDGYRIETGADATGSLDIDVAAKAESDQQAERALLETRHFQNGYARTFTNDKTDIYMAIYDFANSNDASLYLADGFITLYGKGASIYDIADIPSARGFSQGVTSDGRPAIVHGVAFAKGDKFLLVFTRSASATTPGEAKQLASTLYTRT